jgi:hypothetical protein
MGNLNSAEEVSDMVQVSRADAEEIRQILVTATDYYPFDMDNEDVARLISMLTSSLTK